MDKLRDFLDRYSELTAFEKNIVDTTALSIEDLDHYQRIIGRKLNPRELAIAGLLRNHGVLLRPGDFVPSIFNLPKTPVCKVINEFRQFGICPACGSSTVREYLFFGKISCLNKECETNKANHERT